MRYKIETRKRADNRTPAEKAAGTRAIHYVVGYRLRSEHGTPDYILETHTPPARILGELLTSEGMPRYRVEPNPDFDPDAPTNRENCPLSIVENPQPVPAERADELRTRELEAAIRQAIPYSELITAVCELACGNSAPALEITTKVDGIRHGS